MPDIYTEAWYEALKSLINQNEVIAAKSPKGRWTAAIEITGDGKSPYVPQDSTKRFVVHLEDGKCIWYKELPADDTGAEFDLDYRFTGAASVFDEIAAGISDPIDAGLDGRIRIKGDMRFLLRQAELVKEILEIYQRDLETTWPKGKPPYD
jgi:putative sterol carrier protein